MRKSCKASKSLSETRGTWQRIARLLHAGRWRSPYSFRITIWGSLFILTAFLIALAAVRTGNNLLYLVLALALSATLTSGMVARISLHGLFVSLLVPQNVFEGEKVSIKITLHNQKRLLPAFSVRIEDLSLLRVRSLAGRLKRLGAERAGAAAAEQGAAPVLHHAAYFPAIPPGESRSELITQSFAQRGAYRLEGMHLSTRFPFGFFRRGERVDVSGEVLVYPSIRNVSSDLHLLPFLPGKLEGRHVGHGESLYAIRKYQEGESARRIHWKATAKTGRLMIREHAREEESEFCLILDTRVHGPQSGHQREFEEAVSLAASLAAHFAREGADFEYVTPYQHVPLGTGIDHLYRVLKSLAVVRCESADGESLAGLDQELSGGPSRDELQRILSEKVFKIILTSRPRGTLPAPVWRSSYVIYFDEL